MKTYQSESANQTIRILINSSTSFGEISARISAPTFETGIKHVPQWSELIRQFQRSECYFPLFIEIIIAQSDILQVFKKLQLENLERYRKYFFYALFIDIVDIYLCNWNKSRIIFHIHYGKKRVSNKIWMSEASKTINCDRWIWQIDAIMDYKERNSVL